MSKRLSFLAALVLLLFFVPSIHAQEQEKTGDCDDCPIPAERLSLSTKTAVVASDSLYLLQDKESAVYNKKFEAEFKKKYKGKEDFQYEKTAEKVGLFEKIKQFILAWLARNFLNPVGEELSSPYYIVILRILGVLMLGLLLYYLIKAFIQKDVYWLFKKQSKKINTWEDLSTEDFKNTDFGSIIDKAIEQKQYRLAIRLYYLWLLQRLQEQNKITWAPEKTNADYSYEIKEEKERESFAYLSYLYNNIWYGEYELTAADFAKAKSSFDAKLTKP